MHADTIESAFKELHSEVDAVFSYEGHMHMIKVQWQLLHHPSIYWLIDRYNLQPRPTVRFDTTKFYPLQDNEVYTYKIGEPHTHLEGYPKSLKEEFGLEGPVDAAFICQDHHIAHVIKGTSFPSWYVTYVQLVIFCMFSNLLNRVHPGQTLYEVDMKATPRVPIKDGSFALFKYVDAAMCGKDGLKIIVGNHFYHFDSPMVMQAAKMIPEARRVSTELFGCDH